MAETERFIGQFKKTTIIGKDLLGNDQFYEVLAISGAPTDLSAGSFQCSYSKTKGEIKVRKGSYQYPIGTNVEVEKKEGAGKYAYAVIKQLSSGGLDSFAIEITSATKEPTNMSKDGTFLEFSNVLLAEVIGDGDTAKLVQRRVGNLSLIYRLVNGSLCLWAETTGGAAK